MIDKPAWTETVTKYRVQKETKYYCNGKYIDDYNSGYDYYYNEGKNGHAVGSLSPVDVEIEVPYTETINHLEEGHYEWQ